VAKGALGGSDPLRAKPVPFGGAPAGISVNVPKEIEGQDIRLLAFDQDGNEIRSVAWTEQTTVDPRTKERRREYGFAFSNPKEVGHVELRARPYQWVTFKGIHLSPSK